jgi:hypothetical protein
LAPPVGTSNAPMEIKLHIKAKKIGFTSRHERTFLNGQLTVKPCAKKSDDQAD